MKCPNCGDEPIKLYHGGSESVSFKNYLRGFIKCVSCGTPLKRSFGKVFWASFTLFILSFAAVYLSLKLPIEQYLIYTEKFTGGATIVMLTSAVLTSYCSVLSLKFTEVDPDSLD